MHRGVYRATDWKKQFALGQVTCLSRDKFGVSSARVAAAHVYVQLQSDNCLLKILID